MRGFAYDVVIPTHGRSASLLDQTLRSVLAQSVPPRRVIVVVDGNPPAGAALRERWPSVEVVELEKSLGVAAARQSGISAATSDWVCFVDDDDLWVTYKMAVTAGYLAAHPDCSAVRATYYVFAAHHDEPRTLSGQVVDVLGEDIYDLQQRMQGVQPRNDFAYLRIEGDSLALLLDRNRSVIGTTCVRRDLLTSLPPVPVGTHPGDDHLLACLVATRTEWHLISEPLMFYRLHPGQDTRSLGLAAVPAVLRVRQEAWRLCGEFAPGRLASYGPRYRREFRMLIWPLMRAGRKTEACRALSLAFALLPRYRDRALLLIPEPIVWRWRHRCRRSAQSKRAEAPA